MRKTNLKEYDESSLIHLLKQGDVEAFEEIYDRYADRLYFYALKLTKNGDKAKDIVQETFLRLWKNRAEISRNDTVSPLLFTISRNTIYSEFRKVLNAPIFEDYVNFKDALKTKDGVSEDLASYHNFLNRIHVILEDLPPAQREVFQLSRFGLLKIKEIASQKGISEQTVKNRLSLALKTIKNKLKI